MQLDQPSKGESKSHPPYTPYPGGLAAPCIWTLDWGFSVPLGFLLVSGGFMMFKTFNIYGLWRYCREFHGVVLPQAGRDVKEAEARWGLVFRGDGHQFLGSNTWKSENNEPSLTTTGPLGASRTLWVRCKFKSPFSCHCDLKGTCEIAEHCDNLRVQQFFLSCRPPTWRTYLCLDPTIVDGFSQLWWQHL